MCKYLFHFINTMISDDFGSVTGYRVWTDKTCAGTRHSTACGKFKCQTRKNLCIAYTQVNTHAFFLSLRLLLTAVFFFLNETLSHRGHTSPEKRWAPDSKTVKVHLINSWQAPALLTCTGSEAIRTPWRNRGYGRLSRWEGKYGHWYKHILFCPDTCTHIENAPLSPRWQIL